MRTHFFVITALACLASSPAWAQEKCFKDGKDEILQWVNGHSAELNKYAALMEQTRSEGKDPSQVFVDFRGIRIPLSAAYMTVHSEFDRDSKVAVERAVDGAHKCASDVQLPRAGYDFAREYFGLTTVLPEAVTRVDFAEIKAGNIFGSSVALVPKALEDARKNFEKAQSDLGKGMEHAGGQLAKATEDLRKAADPKNWRVCTGPC